VVVGTRQKLYLLSAEIVGDQLVVYPSASQPAGLGLPVGIV
jgi:hypothetical protein